MKIFLVSVIVVLTACSSSKPVLIPSIRTTVPGTILPSEGIESVRYSENIKAYPVGRYVDPNNVHVMHEGHTVYRVETTAKWNLHPNPLVNVPGGPPVRLIDPAHREPPVSEEIIAEINLQRAATQALLNQRQELEKAVQRLAALADAAAKAGEQNQRLQQELSAMKHRLETVESEFKKSSTNVPLSKSEADIFKPLLDKETNIQTKE